MLVGPGTMPLFISPTIIKHWRHLGAVVMSFGQLMLILIFDLLAMRVERVEICGISIARLKRR